MASSVLKYPLRPGGLIEVELPYGAVFLSLGFQHDINIFAWFLVDNSRPGLFKTRRFYIAMTGEELDPKVAGWNFIGRATAASGAFEAHVFMEPL